MVRRHTPQTRLGRRAPLALALGLALSMGLPGTVAAQGDATPAAATASTVLVQNCNDSGFGSLRAAVAYASSGDIIDMSKLQEQHGCAVIQLQSYLYIPQDSLTLLGDDSQAPIISGPASETVLYHSGSGTLTASHVTIMNGNSHNSFGGCIDSISGNVNLVASAVKYCTAEGSFAKGGAVYAGGSVTLDNSRVGGSTANNTSSGDALGGAIYAAGDVNLKNDSWVGKSTAKGKNARGGGIYTRGDLVVVGTGPSRIVDNKAIATSTAKGGGANVQGTMTVTLSQGVLVDGNRAEGSNANGGGLYLPNGGSIKYGSITDNHADRLGGGIFAKGSLTLEGVTIAGNHADTAGGGLRVTGDIDIEGSTIADNTSDRAAGAGLSGNAGDSITISQSTISGNEASNSEWGAGLYLGHDATIRNTTITGNIERNGSDTKYGAGISLQDGVTLDMSSTIVSGNFLENASGDSVPSDVGVSDGGSNATITGDHNFVTMPFVSLPPDTIGGLEEAELGPLQHNGGLTMTHEPLSGSPVIDMGAKNGFSKDQRGFQRLSGPQVDIGSVEYPSDRIFADGFELH